MLVYLQEGCVSAAKAKASILLSLLGFGADGNDSPASVPGGGGGEGGRWGVTLLLSAS